MIKALWKLEVARHRRVRKTRLIGFDPRSPLSNFDLETSSNLGVPILAEELQRAGQVEAGQK